MSRQHKAFLMICGFCFFLTTTSGMAQLIIPDSTGFNGYLLVSGGNLNAQTNLIASGAPAIDKVSNSSAGSVTQKPTTINSASLAIGGELSYTFAKSRTQIYMGNRLEDVLRLDAVVGVGIRQELKDKSILAMSFLFTPITLKFWEDPYVEEIPRVKTELNFPGIRLRGSRLFGTGLELTASFRKYTFDDERSGEWLLSQGRLDAAELPKLDRNGNTKHLEVAYWFSSKMHNIVPKIQYLIDDHDGEAIANQGYRVQLTYILATPKFLINTNARYGKRYFKDVHPVYDKKMEGDRFGASLTLSHRILALKSSSLNLFFNAEYYGEQLNVDFFDSQMTMISMGLLWQHLKP